MGYDRHHMCPVYASPNLSIRLQRSFSDEMEMPEFSSIVIRIDAILTTFQKKRKSIQLLTTATSLSYEIFTSPVISSSGILIFLKILLKLSVSGLSHLRSTISSHSPLSSTMRTTWTGGSAVWLADPTGTWTLISPSPLRECAVLDRLMVTSMH